MVSTADVNARSTACARVDDPNDAADLGRLRRDRRLARVEVGGAREDVPGAARAHRRGPNVGLGRYRVQRLGFGPKELTRQFKSSKDLTGTFKIAHKFVKR